MTKVNDFTPLPTYSQTRISNKSYINVTTTRTDSDGTVTQTSTLICKR